MIFSYIVAALAFVGTSQAATVNIAVGANNTIAFLPPSVTASVGDTVLFTFMSSSHSVVSSTFADPCTSSGNISSPFFPVTAGATGTLPTFSFVVNTTAPIWLHCSQVGHCPSGMVAAVNAPTTGNTFSLFQQIAEGKASAPPSSSSSSGSPKPSSSSPPNPNPYGPPNSPPPSGSSGAPSPTTTKSSGTLTRDFAGLAALVMSFASATLGLMI